MRITHRRKYRFKLCFYRLINNRRFYEDSFQKQIRKVSSVNRIKASFINVLLSSILKKSLL